MVIPPAQIPNKTAEFRRYRVIIINARKRTKLKG
jgi:hypothetical protein